MSHPAVIRLVLVDDQTLLREGIRALVVGQPDLEVVAGAASVRALPADVPEPDVVVTSVAGGEAECAPAIQLIRARFAGVAVFALTDRDNCESIPGALGAGADGYVSKSASKSDFLAGIRSVARGDGYPLPPSETSCAPTSRARPDEFTVAGLTRKETEVLELLALGHTNSEIAVRVGSSLRTIETHRAHILLRLHLRTRAELVRFALGAGMLRPDTHEAGRAGRPPVAFVGDFG